MLGKAIFARRASPPATAPSSQLQLELTVSTPSRFTRKLRKIKQVFKRSSSFEKDASPSILHPRQDLPVPAHPRQVLQSTTHPSQGPNSMTHRGAESFDQRPRGSYPSLPPVLGSSPLFQPREETFATSPLPTPARPTFSGNSLPLHAPLRPVDTTPTTALSPRSARPARSSPRFQPHEEISASSTPSTASRPTFSPNPSIILTPPQSFKGAPSVDRSPRTSPLLCPSKEIPAASTPSTTHYPTLSPNPSLLAPPKSANTIPTAASSQLSLTSQLSEEATDHSATAKKIADLRATIAVLELKRDDYLDNVQHELRNRICPRVRVYQRQRDDQVAALERAKTDLAQKIEVRDKIDAMWREIREGRWQFDEVALEVKKEWLEKLKRCRELKIESNRLLFQQEQWVRRGWRRREWGVDDSEYISEASEGQYSAPPTSVQQSSYVGGSSGNSQSRDARSTASVSTNWAPQGLYAVNAYQRASTQGSSSMEFEMVGETVRSHLRARAPRNPSSARLTSSGPKLSDLAPATGPRTTTTTLPKSSVIVATHSSAHRATQQLGAGLPPSRCLRLLDRFHSPTGPTLLCSIYYLLLSSRPRVCALYISSTLLLCSPVFYCCLLLLDLRTFRSCS